MKRNYKGTDHLGAAADYEERLLLNSGAEPDRRRTDDKDSSFTTSLPASASIIMEDAISIGERTEDDEQIEGDNTGNNIDNSQRRSSTADQSLEDRNSATSGDHDLVQSAPIVALAYVLSESDERIIVELPSLMVRPLKVVQGTFQVSNIECLCSFIIVHPLKM